MVDGGSGEGGAGFHPDLYITDQFVVYPCKVEVAG